jgi:DNA ligase 1
MLLADLAATSALVASTSARGGKVAALAEALRQARPEEAAAAIAFLSGDLLQRQTGVGYRSLQDLPAAAAEPSLQVGEVDAAFAGIAACSGAGSQAERRRLLHQLFGRATADEQRYLAALVGGGLRQGALEGVVAEAVAKAADVPAASLRRALMLGGDLRQVGAVALQQGEAGLAGIGLQVGVPLLPMLAQSAATVAEALEKTGPAGIEWKLDGARIQVHRSGTDVAVYTRSLDDITSRVPELVEAALALDARELVLDGEAIALRPDGRPLPFQVTGSRVGMRDHQSARARAVPLTPAFFDLLHLDGRDLIDLPGRERAAALAQLVPQDARIRRLEVEEAAAAEAFLDSAVAMGHEGVVLKALDAPYLAGRRGAGWIKVKPTHTLDLVVLGVEWGHGRRTGKLSNLHLGARDPAGGFVMLGKTFKGLTDAMLAWQTEELLKLETSRDSYTVYVRPELVVEIAFDGVQASTRYPGGVALRFARVKRYRTDKQASEADTIDEIRAIHARSTG